MRKFRTLLLIWGSKDEVIPINEACHLSCPGKYTIQLSRSAPDDPKHTIMKSNTIKVTE